ncbi:MAG: hypothetical protein NVSMB65_21640 [Chloroflexota bacterium]
METMAKRTLMALGLGLALLGGGATLQSGSPVHAASVQTVQADLIAGATEPQTAEADAGTADAGPDVQVQQGDQTGPDAASADAGPDVQQGDQTTPDTGAPDSAE